MYDECVCLPVSGDDLYFIGYHLRTPRLAAQLSYARGKMRFSLGSRLFGSPFVRRGAG